MIDLPKIEKVIKELLPLKGKTIIKVKTVKDTIVYQNHNPTEISKTVIGKKILDIKRYGSIFWFEIENSYQLGFQCSSTAEIQVRMKKLIKSDNDKLINSSRFSIIKIYLTDDKELIKNIDKWNESEIEKEAEKVKQLENNEKVECFDFSEVDHVSRLFLSKNIMKEKPLCNYGFDVKNNFPSFEEFLEKIRTKNCAIKKLLLDTSFCVGIGNWIADEILYQSKIHPTQNVKFLNDEDINNLYDSIKDVLNISILVDGDYSRFPSNWIFHYRNKDEMIIPGSGRVEFLKGSGKTTAFVPKIQKVKRGNKRRISLENNALNSKKEKTKEVAVDSKQTKKTEENIKKNEDSNTEDKMNKKDKVGKNNMLDMFQVADEKLTELDMKISQIKENNNEEITKEEKDNKKETNDRKENDKKQSKRGRRKSILKRDKLVDENINNNKNNEDHNLVKNNINDNTQKKGGNLENMKISKNDDVQANENKKSNVKGSKGKEKNNIEINKNLNQEGILMTNEESFKAKEKEIIRMEKKKTI